VVVQVPAALLAAFFTIIDFTAFFIVKGHLRAKVPLDPTTPRNVITPNKVYVVVQMKCQHSPFLHQ
jgi:hypothetical protein